MYVVMLYEKSWSSECRTFKVNGSFSRGRPRKSWSEVIRNEPKESKVSKDLVIDKNASVLSNHLIINHMIDCNQHCTVNSVIL